MPYYLSTSNDFLDNEACNRAFNLADDGGLEFWQVSMYRHLVCGLLLAILTFVEWFTYTNLPLERALILEGTDRTQREQVAIENANASNEQNVFVNLYKKLFGGKYK
jgi:hypothetical protein